MSISVLDISKQLLDMKKILYLPKTKIVIDENLFNIYLNLIDHKTLLKISEENNLSNLQIIKDLFNSKGLNKSIDLNIDLNKYNNIKIEENIENIQKGKIYEKDDINLVKLEALDNYHNNLKEINKNILDLKEEIEQIDKKYNNFQCIEKYKKTEYFSLSNYIINCSEYSNKNINWYNIILNIDKLDNDFNNIVNDFMKKNKIPLNYYKIKKKLEMLKNNDYLKNIFKEKILECSKQPSKFFNLISKSLSLDSWNEYVDNCSGDCLLYLNKDYKDFLKKKDSDIGISEKILILIYC